MPSSKPARGSASSAVPFVVIILGLLALGAYLTGGFGLLRSVKVAEQETPFMVRDGNRISVPDGSPLRDRLTVAPASTERVNSKLAIPGIVEADPARVATVLPPLAGRLMELKVSLGDRVSRDQVLAIIDSPDLAQARADDAKAKDALDLADKNLKRQQGSLAIGGGSRRDLDQVISDQAQAAAEYKRTRARLGAVSPADESSHGGSMLTVKVPVSGSVTSVSVAPGNMINDPTQPIMTISDLYTVWVTAMVAEKDVSFVGKGQDAEVTLTAYPGRVLRGKVDFVSDVLEADSRRNKLRIAFANPDYLLKPNMFATVTVAGPDQFRVVLPTSALLMNNDRTTVFVATQPWTFERRAVVPLLEEGSSVAILSGLTVGEQVVVKGGILLND